METDELLAILANLQTTVDGLSNAMDSMSDSMGYNFSQLIGFGQGQQPQNAADNATTTSTSPVVGQHDAAAADIIPPSLFGGNQLGTLFDNLTEWFEKSIPNLIGDTSSGEGGQGGGSQFNMDNYLDRTRAIESSNGTNTGAPNALAQGDFQFIPSTWEDTKKRLVEQGHPEAANWTMDDRNDPDKARLAAENLAEFNRNQLKEKLGRDPGEVETYTAHLLGAKGATDLLSAKPDSLAKDVISESALKSNEGIFKDTGVEIDKLTAKQLVDSIAKFYGGKPPEMNGPNIMRGADLMSDTMMPTADMGAAYNEMMNSARKSLAKIKDFGVNTVGSEIGSNIPPNFSVAQNRNFSVPQNGITMSPPRPMSPSASSADDSVGNAVPNPSSNNPIFDFFNYFGVNG